MAERPLAVVIGAGVAGLQSARALLRSGYQVVVLEQGRGPGGTWRRNYSNFSCQGVLLCVWVTMLGVVQVAAHAWPHPAELC